MAIEKLQSSFQPYFKNIEEYLAYLLRFEREFNLQTSVSKTVNELQKQVVELAGHKTQNMQNIIKTLQLLKIQLHLSSKSPYSVQISSDDRNNIHTTFESLTVFLSENFDIKELTDCIKHINPLKHILDQKGFAITPVRTWKGVSYEDARDIDPNTYIPTGFRQAEHRNYIPLDPTLSLNKNNSLCVVEMPPNTQQQFHCHNNNAEYGILFPGQSAIIRTNQKDEEKIIDTVTMVKFDIAVYHTLQNSSKNNESRQHSYPWHVFLKPPNTDDRTSEKPETLSESYELVNIKPNEPFTFGDGQPQAYAILIDSKFNKNGNNLGEFFKQNKISWKYGIIIPYQGFVGITRVDENNEQKQYILQAKDRIQENKIAHFSIESNVFLKPIGKKPFQALVIVTEPVIKH